jgi:putative ABC transport system permease protein
VLELLVAELRFRTARTLSAASGVALGVALFVALSAFSAGFREAAKRPLSGLGADILLTRPAGNEPGSAALQTTRGPRLPFGLSVFAAGDVDTVKRVGNVGLAAGALLLWDFGAQTYQTVLGVDAGETAIGPGRVGGGVGAGRFLDAGETEAAVVDRHYAAFFSIKPGDTVHVGTAAFKVVGIVEAREDAQAAAANLYISLADAQSLVGVAPGVINQIYVRVAQASSVDGVLRDTQDALGEISAITEQSIIQVMGGIARISDRFGNVASLVALLGGLLLTGLALAASVSERRREIGLSKAVGWTTAQVTRHFLAEGLVVSALGAVAGLGLGWLMTFALHLVPVDTALLSPSTPSNLSYVPQDPASTTLPAHVTLASLVLALGMAIAGGLLASWLTARRAAATRPGETLRG